MAEIFRRLLNLSIGATWVVGAVVLVRLLTAKAPKWIRVILWGLVALRLIFPISLQSSLSMVPVSEPIAPVQLTVSPDIPKASVSLPLAEPGATLPPIFQTNQEVPVSTPEPERPLDILGILGWVWLGGCVLMLGYSALSYWHLRQKLDTAIREDGIWRSERVISPFVLGILRPRIYLPFSLQGEQADLVTAHEKAHIHRKDHWWKPLGFLLLSIHWFNPAMWLAYVLLCRDIEFACDEKVIRDMAPDLRADYSQALLSCAVHRRQISACPLAFGESGVKGRIRSVLSYKKPAFWLILVGLFACIAVAVFFLTVPKGAESSLTPPLSEIHDSYTLGQAKKDGCLVMEDSTVTSGKAQWEEFLEKSRDGEACAIRVVNYYPLGDPNRYDPAYLEAVKDQYPMLFVHDLTFDGKTYTWQGYEDGKLHTETYRYLKEDIEQARTEQATYDYCHRYLLVDNPDVTWDEIFQGLISSQYPNPTPKHASVYTDFIRFPEPTLWFSHDMHRNDFNFTSEYTLSEYPQAVFSMEHGTISAFGTPLVCIAYSDAYFCDLTGDGVRELCAEESVGSGIADLRIVVYDPVEKITYELSNRAVTDYHLSVKNDRLWVTEREWLSSGKPDGKIRSQGELLLIGSAYGDGLHLGYRSDEILISNPPSMLAVKNVLEDRIVEQYAGTGGPETFVIAHFSLIDSAQWGDPVYKDGVVDRTTVYGAFSCAQYVVEKDGAKCLHEIQSPMTATLRLSSTGATYITEFSETVPEDYRERAEKVMLQLQKACHQEAEETYQHHFDVEFFHDIMARKTIQYSQELADLEWQWDQDPSKAPKEYADTYFVYRWEDLPTCEIPDFRREGFMSLIVGADSYDASGENRIGSPQYRWKIYNEDGSIYSRSPAPNPLDGQLLKPSTVVLPKNPGIYYLEATIYWEDYDTHIRYGMRLVVQ